MQNGPSPEALPLLIALRQEATRVGLHPAEHPLDAETESRFARYYALLLEWNERAGLTTVTDPVEVAQRHFGESLALAEVLRHAEVLTPGARLIDLGAGAGFPGLPIAILDSSLQVVLLESPGRRADFLAADLATGATGAGGSTGT